MKSNYRDYIGQIWNLKFEISSPVYPTNIATVIECH